MDLKPKWREQGQEPDYRFTFANERTFLAWIRTALALLAGGILLVQFVTALQPRGVVVLISVSLCIASAMASGVAYARWKANEIAMRNSQPLPSTTATPLLSAFLLILSLAVVILFIRQ
jgi:putative membrane protein